ncbi:hypothetical protein PoB_004356900 [Plakobranchus ocellatus]|uniref:Uncharacterized protein n=1 Tax=Plakobranchus ocellatus TaxID=259542 RepID=A0AAV4BE13_9GAST|nr:hypothetical protein PoB_004356900 [Plakobranchus ocellatus]
MPRVSLAQHMTRDWHDTMASPSEQLTRVDESQRERQRYCPLVGNFHGAKTTTQKVSHSCSAPFFFSQHSRSKTRGPMGSPLPLGDALLLSVAVYFQPYLFSRRLSDGCSLTSYSGERTTKCPQQGDLRLSGPPSSQDAGGGAQTRDRRVPADLRADSLGTVPPTPQYYCKEMIERF